MKVLVLCALVTVAVSKQIPLTNKSAAATSEVVIIGGSGDGITSQVVTSTSNCFGKNVTPRFPDASYSTQNGWSAGVFSADGEPKILLCGGKDIQETDECHILKVGSGKWESTPCLMKRPRTHASMINTMDGSVIISGGYSEQIGWLSDVIRLTQVNTDCSGDDCCKWEDIGSFDEHIGLYAHCSLQYDEDTLVFIGGNTWSNDYGQYDVATIQILNTRTGEWNKGADMPMGRQRMGCIKTEIDGRSGIMVTGGYCHGNPDFEECDQLRPRDTIFYDFENNAWEDLGANLVVQRDGITLANLDGTIFAFGGQQQGGVKDTIEMWDTDSKQWKDSGRRLDEGVAYYAAAIIPDKTYEC